MYLGCGYSAGDFPSMSTHDFTEGIDNTHGLSQSSILTQGGCDKKTSQSNWKIINGMHVDHKMYYRKSIIDPVKGRGCFRQVAALIEMSIRTKIKFGTILICS